MLKVVNNTTVVWRPTYHRRRTTPSLPHDDTLPRHHQSNI